MLKLNFKFYLPLFLLILLLGTHNVKAQSENVEAENPNQTQEQDADATLKENFFKAKVEIINNVEEQVGLDGVKRFIQDFTLKGLEGEWKDKEIIINGSEFNLLGKDAYKKNDVLLISESKGVDGQENFAIIDYVRESSLYFLVFIFVMLVIIMGRWKGIKALVSLGISFLIIVYFILPQIIHGANPVLISAIGGILITVISLYVTYGFKTFTHLAGLSIGSSLIITLLISQWFTELTKLTGNVEEQTTYLSQMLGGTLNFKGLLLAGFIIGALGVLDDVVINQISLIEELHTLDPSLTWKKLFQRGLKVGIDHISAIVNSLFLAYVGASLPLLLLFFADTRAQLGFANTLNLEIITTEVVRTLTGSVGLILAVPISTLIAAVYLPKKKVKLFSETLKSENK